MLVFWVQVELTHLSACKDALWGLDSHGRVNIRTLSPSCPTGLHWTPLDLSQLSEFKVRKKLVHLEDRSSYQQQVTSYQLLISS